MSLIKWGVPQRRTILEMRTHKGQVENLFGLNTVNIIEGSANKI